MSGSTVLVTGGSGFIGSHLARALLKAGHQVRVLDDLSTGRLSNLDGVRDDIDLREADLRDADACGSACQGVEVVYHQGALPSVPRSVAEPQLTFDVNVVGSHNIYMAARAAGARRVVFASSSSIYGNRPELPKHEEMAPQPVSPYAAHKLSAEQLGVGLAGSTELEFVALRYFNVFGPRQNPDSGYAAVIAAFAGHLLRGTRPVIHGDGGQTRDFTFVEDVVLANMRAAEAPGISGQVMNIACGQRTSVKDLYDIIARLTGREDTRPIHEGTRAGDVRDSLAAVDRARELMGWESQFSLEDGLQKTVDGLRVELGTP